MFSLPYILLLLIYLLLTWQWEKQADNVEAHTRITVAAFGIFVFFFGLRGFVFYDWASYYPEFTHLPDWHTLQTLPLSRWRFEPGFMVLSVICKSIVNNFNVFVCFFACLNAILLFRFLLRYNANLPFAIFIFIAMDGLTLSTDLMRNSLALLLILNAFPFITERRLLPYLGCCLLAATIHKSALVFIPCYFILDKAWNKWVMLAFFLAANAIYVLHIPILKETILLIVGYLRPDLKLYVETYMDFGIQGSVLSIGYIERLVTGFLLFFYMDKLRRLRADANLFINALFLYLTLKLALSEFSTISARVSLLFAFGYWVLWVDFAKCITLANNRKLYYIFITVFCLVKTGLNTNNYLAEYENILFPSKTYNERLHQFQQHFNDK